MIKHTKGPWYAWDNGSGMSVSYGDPSESLVPSAHAVYCRLVHFKVPDPWTDAQWEEIKANAHLMAAAPEMLEELKRIRADSGTSHGRLDTLIAKAEGRKLCPTDNHKGTPKTLLESLCNGMEAGLVADSGTPVSHVRDFLAQHFSQAMLEATETEAERLKALFERITK